MALAGKGARGPVFRAARRQSLAWAASVLLGGTALLSGGGAQAQSGNSDAAAWPQRPVKLVVPYAPGGTADTLGRLIAQHLSAAFKQPFVVENRGGAGGMIGSQQVAKSAPDGYTLVVSGIGSHVIAPAENKSYDPLADFTHIALLGGPPAVLVVNPSVPVHSVKELVDFANRSPQGLSWGSSGTGTHAHLLGELFARSTGIRQTHIGYKGGSPAVADLVSGHIPAAFMALTSANAQIKAGRIRALALTSEQRLADFPDVPTFAEAGYPKLTAITWFSLSGPAGLPPAIVDKLNAEVRRGLKSDAVKKVLAMEDIQTQDWDAPTFTRFVKTELERWQPLARAVGKPKGQ